MGKPNIELARLRFQEIQNVVQPDFSNIDELIVHNAQANETDSIAQKEAERNALLLTRMVGALPVAKSTTVHGVRSAFSVESPLQARAIQSSVVWLRTWSAAFDMGGAGGIGIAYPAYDSAIRPYWILGSNHTSLRSKQFLLAEAAEKPTHRGDLDTGPNVSFGSWSPVHRQLRRTKNSSLILFKPNHADRKAIDSVSSKYFELPTTSRDTYPKEIDTMGVINRVSRLATLFDKSKVFVRMLSEHHETQHGE